MKNNLYFDTSEANNLGKNDIEPDSSIATPSNVKSNHLFKDAQTREVLVGTMPINESENIKINPASSYHSDDSYTIPEGYHDGTGKVYTGSLREYTQGNAIPSQVANNKIFWVNGQRLVGTLDLDMNDQVGTATADDLISGKTAWVNREKITGTIPKLPRRDKTLLAGESYNIPYGLSPGTSVITAASLESQTAGTAESDDILLGETAWVNGEKVTGSFNLSGHIREFLADTDALQYQVLNDKKFYSSEYGIIVSGKMPDHSEEGYAELDAGVKYTIPEGYYDGNSGVQVKSISELTQATAKESEIVFNKTAWVNGEKLVGTMPSNTSSHILIGSGESYDIPEGYHTGNGKVTAKSISDDTPGTATSNDILYPKTAWVRGEQLTGTIPTIPTITRELTPGETFNIPTGYHSGSSFVWTRSLEDLTRSDAKEDQILDGKTAWVNGVKLTGNMPNNPSEDIQLDAGESYTIPEGYHNGTAEIKATDLEDQTIGNARSSDISINKIAWVNGERIVGSLEFDGTANPDDVLIGTTFYKNDPSEKLTGTLELTGTAQEENVAEGVTFYNTDPKRKLVGTLKLLGDAEPSQVLAGSSFYSNSVINKLTGTMRNNGSIYKELDSGESYTIPEGYHSGLGNIRAKELPDQTPGDAVAADILLDKTAWVNGARLTGTLNLIGTAEPSNVLAGVSFYSDDPKQKLTGTMTDIGSVSRSLYAGQNYTIPEGYHDGTGIISAIDLEHQTSGTATENDILQNKTAWVNGERISGNISTESAVIRTDVLAGEEIIINPGYYQAEGRITTASLASQTAANAVASDMLIGKTAWVNGEKITGTITTSTPITRTGVLAGETVNIPAGYYTGAGIVTTESLENQTRATAEVHEILYGKTAWVDGVQYTGTMIDRSGWGQTDVPGGSTIIIPQGYHDGTGIITTEESIDTPGTATPDTILDSYTAWVDGEQITGNIPIRDTYQVRLTAGSEIEVPPGYYPNGIIFYALYTDQILDLSGTTAWTSEQILNPEDSGYVDFDEEDNALIVVDDIIRP